MKKLLPILCALSLLLCGCGARPQAPATLTLSLLTDPEDPAQALSDFEDMLDYAIQSDDIKYLKLYSATLPPKDEDLIITDEVVIRSILSNLKKLKVEASRHEQGAMTGLFYHACFGFENGEVELCAFSEKWVLLDYYGPSVEYRLAIQNPEIVEELFALISKQIK